MTDNRHYRILQGRKEDSTIFLTVPSKIVHELNLKVGGWVMVHKEDTKIIVETGIPK